MATDDARVAKIILVYLTNAGYREDACCGVIGTAFRSIQAYRQQAGNSLDVDVAAAEHYLFARWMVCTGNVSPTQMKVLVVGYDAKKMVDRLRGKENAAQVTANPVSPPDRDVVMWGLLGCDEGGADKQRCNPDVDTPLWKPVKDVLGKSPY